jgi:molybdate transport system regulatory protein
MPARRPPAVAFASALNQPSADKRVDILRRVVQTGSISQAGRDAGVSYKAAWQAIDTLTNLAGVPLVERAVGGAGGGGAKVTAQGLELLAAAEAIDSARLAVLARLQAATTVEGGDTHMALPLHLRTSMRNQVPCTVKALRGRGPIVQVQLQLVGDDAVLVARITRESVELLGLQAGLPVLALCKATAVRVWPAEATPPAMAGADSANRLAARVRRVARSTQGDEVAAELAGGSQWVGFAAASSGLRARAAVVLQVDEAAMVIALAG